MQKDFPWLKHEYRPETLTPELMKISKALDMPIVKQGIWVISESGDYKAEGKYADYYPQVELLILTEDAKRGNVLKPCLDILSAPFTSVTEPRKMDSVQSVGTGFLDDIFDDIIDAECGVTMINNIHENKWVNEYMDNVPPNVTVINDQEFNLYSPNEKIVEHIYNMLTSAEYHLSIGSLYAQPMNDGGYHAYQSKLRQEEVIRLFSEYLKYFSGKDHFYNEENFAIDTPQYVIYFHMDNVGDFSNELRQLNKYLHNDKTKGILPFYDSKDRMNEISYEKWASVLDGKPVLMFGWEKMTDPNYVWNCFLGEYNMAGLDNNGNIKLALADLRFDFPV